MFVTNDTKIYVDHCTEGTLRQPLLTPDFSKQPASVVNPALKKALPQEYHDLAISRTANPFDVLFKKIRDEISPDAFEDTKHVSTAISFFCRETDFDR